MQNRPRIILADGQTMGAVARTPLSRDMIIWNHPSRAPSQDSVRSKRRDLHAASTAGGQPVVRRTARSGKIILLALPRSA